jgi:chromate reductase
LFGASGGVLGTARAQYQLRQTLVFLDGRPVNKPEVMIGQAQTKFVEGKLTDEATGKMLADLGAALALAVRQAKAAATVK